MKERPIIFNSDEVRAILEGRKTMMRRVIKPQPHEIAYRDRHENIESACFWRYGEEREDCPTPKDCPFGQPGDRLWVKETWRLPHGAPKRWVDYKVDDARDGFKWRSPVSMPRWASRITLEIINVHVERLQDISEEDALAEGIRRISHGMEGDYFHFSRTEADPQNWCFPDDAFRELWDSVNTKLGYRWDANPWVWVIEFKREQATELAKQLAEKVARAEGRAKLLEARVAELAKAGNSAIVELRKNESEYSYERYLRAVKNLDALIEQQSRRVPRAIDAIAGKLEEAIGEEDWNEAKSVLNDLWDLRDDGYKVEG